MPVPSIRHFAKAHGLSTFTVSAAYSRLVAQNWLTARPGSGYRVARTVRNTQPITAPASWIPPRIGASWLLADIFADHRSEEPTSDLPSLLPNTYAVFFL